MESSAKIGMKKYMAAGLYLMLFLFSFQNASAATMGDYCQVPPFIGSTIGPNIMYLLDVSGSMKLQAYSKDSAGDKDKPYDPSITYEGYFDPSQYYQNTGTATDPVYVQTGGTIPCTPNLPRICVSIDTGLNCFEDTAKHGDATMCSGLEEFNCASSETCTPLPGTLQTTGNFLNYVYMDRLDLARWAVTGGTPFSCDSTSSGAVNCNPWQWNTTSASGTGKVGDPTKGCDANGCWLRSAYKPVTGTPQVDGYYFDPALYGTFTSSTKTTCKINPTGTYDATTYKNYPCYSATKINSLKIRATWARMNDALVKNFEMLPIVPRMGMMTYGGSNVDAIFEQVYVGDFTGSGTTSSFPFMNLITALNRAATSDYTPTAPALWDTLAYYEQSSPNYGGFTPAGAQASNFWRNPLYTCPSGGGSNCIPVPCVRNFVILLSDGQWNSGGTSNSDHSCRIEAGALTMRSTDPVVPAWKMHMGYMNSGTKTKLTAIYGVGMFVKNSPAEQAMKNISMYGSFEYTSETFPANLFPGNYNRLPNSTDTCTVSSTPAGCSSSTLSGSLCRALPPSSPDWDKDGDNVPDTYLSAENATEIKQKLMDAVLTILSRVTSGTAASVLASGEGSGANLVQATYYPKRKFYTNSIDWTGGLQNLWYYIDPKFANSSIRQDDGDHILNLMSDGTAAHKDYIARLYFDTNAQRAMAKLYKDMYGDSKLITYFKTVDFEMLGNLWEAGKLLWNRSPGTRLIYTPLKSNFALTTTANSFAASNVNSLRPLLNTDVPSATNAVNTDLANNVINWVRGTDRGKYLYTAGSSSYTEFYRKRTTRIDLNGDGDDLDTVWVSGVSMNESIGKVWKLGDIINSTPRIASWVQLNGYDSIYKDDTYSSFVSTATYTSRGMVYVGANDGMLHAFKLGLLEQRWTGQDETKQPARLNGTDLGKEMWAFIPTHVLPYLKYLKETEYCHIQSVDLTPFLFDASIEAKGTPNSGDYWSMNKTTSSWRTILIGGMKLGGACKPKDDNCATNTPNGVCAPVTVTGGESVGYSSYFALDVTDEIRPELLWEFSDANLPAADRGLGFTTSGPSIVRINSRTAGATNSTDDGKTTNGRFFVVFGSGPTGPIDSTSQKFQARSDQPLRIFVLDLKTGKPARVINTLIPEAFAGSMLNANFDIDLDYQDDAIYIPYVKKCVATTAFCTKDTWTDGGVLRILTNEDLDGANVSATGNTALNPGKWVYGKVMDGIGPVTSSVGKIQDTNSGKLRLFFGTGRYFYRSDAGTDDPSNQRHLFGVVEPCAAGGIYNGVCRGSNQDSTYTRTFAQLGAVSLAGVGGSEDADGWVITLDPAGMYTFDEDGDGLTTDEVPRAYNSERIITDPLATKTGIIYFTSYMPYNDSCSVGGKTFIWATRYDTGGAAGNLLKGTALIQVSTGSIEQINLADAFKPPPGVPDPTNEHKGERRTAAIEGVPPTSQGLSIIQTPPPTKRVLHSRER